MYIIAFLIILFVSGIYLYKSFKLGREAAKEHIENKKDFRWSMYIDEAIKRLEPYGFTREEVFRMDLNEFISVVNCYIGKVASVSFERKVNELCKAKK